MSILQENPWFQYYRNDLGEFTIDQYDMAIVITLMLTLEQRKPGLIKNVLFQLALLADDECAWWTDSGDPQWSLRMQEQLHNWLLGESIKLREEIKKDNNEPRSNP